MQNCVTKGVREDTGPHHRRSQEGTVSLYVSEIPSPLQGPQGVRHMCQVCVLRLNIQPRQPVENGLTPSGWPGKDCVL